MKRLAAIAALIAGVATFALLGTGAGNDDGDAYLVRAEFRNAFSVIPGEDVKVAGVFVGKIADLTVTEHNTADVVLRIDEPGFRDFRSDASCTIRPQSLIGEKFVECTPTRPREEGAPVPPPLAQIKDGEGKGQYRLPLSRTSRPVDLDLLNNIMRLPFRQRFSIIINELGTGLAARGQDLRNAVRAANPALRETDEVLKILATQNDVLAKLASDSDRALAPLARNRDRVGSFITQANTVAQATAARRSDFEANFERLPRFLSELRPTMTRLGGLADEFTPVLGDLDRAAPDLGRLVAELGPFSQAATPAFKSLGNTADVGRRSLVASRPILKDLSQFASASRPVAANLQSLLTSLRDTGGMEHLMNLLFYTVSSTNGFDALGHYLRAQLIVNPCSDYQVDQANSPGCSARFVKRADATASAASAGRNASARALLEDPNREPVLARTDAVLNGISPQDALAARPMDQDGKTATAEPAQPAAKRAPAGTPPPPSSSAAQPGAGTPAQSSLLDYLLGDG
jgi:phospholipid/cholesterol/gamma-HCH transport system substrate-binding protein